MHAQCAETTDFKSPALKADLRSQIHVNRCRGIRKPKSRFEPPQVILPCTAATTRLVPLIYRLAGIREVTVPMPSVLTDSADTGTPRAQSPVYSEPDPACIIPAPRGGERRPAPPEFPPPPARGAPARSNGAATGGGGSMVECVMMPVRDWFCGGGVHAGGGRRVEQRGLSPLAGTLDRGRGAARRCGGCGTAWDVDFARCPICGAASVGHANGDGGGRGGQPASVSRVAPRGSAATDDGPSSGRAGTPRPVPGRAGPG